MIDYTYKLDKYKLADYIIKRYFHEYNQQITMLKLQKSMYFLFGFWTLENALKDEGEHTLNETYLFKPNYQAWKYGPVDIDIYDRYKEKLCK